MKASIHPGADGPKMGDHRGNVFIVEVPREVRQDHLGATFKSPAACFEIAVRVAERLIPYENHLALREAAGLKEVSIHFDPCADMALILADDVVVRGEVGHAGTVKGARAERKAA